MTSFNEYLEEQLKSLSFRHEYDALEDEFAAIQSAIDAEKEGQLAHKGSLERDDVMQTG